MTNYEEGYCPYNGFMNPMFLPLEAADEVEKMAKVAWEHLRGIIPAMVYKKGKNNPKVAYIFELLLTQDLFGFEIMIILELMVEVNSDTKVLLEDVSKPEEVKGEFISENETFKVGITRVSNYITEIIIFKK